MTRRLFGWVAVAAMATAAPAFAQHGKPVVPPGQAKRVQQGPATSGFAPVVASDPDSAGSFAGRVRSFGSWLDDASVLPRGESWMALSATRWSLAAASGLDAPVIDFSAGVSPRVQAAITVPYFRATEADGLQLRGIGDLYLGTKVMLRDPAQHALGVAVGATAEILSDLTATSTGLNRVNWVLPVSLEHRFDGGRVYGSTGVFSRGVFFASGAVERTVTDSFVLAAALTHAYAMDGSGISEEIGLSRRRLDVSGTAAYTVAPAVAVFGSIGRTLWGLDPDSTRLLATGGVSIQFTHPRAIP